MFVIQDGKMVVEEKEIVMSDRDQESQPKGGKDLGRDLEREVRGKKVGDQGREKENVAGPGQKTKRKVEGTPDHVHEIEGIDETGKVGKEESKKAILILKMSLFGKTKLPSKKSPWMKIIRAMGTMKKDMETTKIHQRER
jgi:hypothetical protein